METNKTKPQELTKEECIEIVHTMYSKRKVEVNAMFSSGMFNEIVKGYLVATLQGEVPREEIISIVEKYGKCLDEISPSKAREFYENF